MSSYEPEWWVGNAAARVKGSTPTSPDDLAG
jgi:hypothetical protein